MMKIPPTIAACAASIACLSVAPAMAAETLKVPQEFALQREIKVDVTQMGVVLDLGSPIDSVNLSHMSNVVFTGLDGVLCDAKAECPDAPRPTKLLLRKIPPIKFKDQLPSTDGTRMLFVATKAGVYRFRLKPLNASPKYTQVLIQSEFPSGFPAAITR